jgi:predicted  nucleic acid-binding Zn-ribbon protein
MIDESLLDGHTLKEKLAADQEWIKHNISAVQVEIDDLIREIRDRESIIGQQNVDLQDTYRRYMTLTSNQCTKELNRILNQAEDDAITQKIDQIHTEVDAFARNLDLLSHRLTEVEKRAAYVEVALEKASNVVSDIDHQNSAAILKIRTRRLNLSQLARKANINHTIADQRIAALETLSADNARIEAENDKRSETLAFLHSERYGLQSRVMAMTVAAQSLQEHILGSITQKPLPIFQFEKFLVADVPPIVRRASSRFGNLVVLAPIHSLSRRIQLSSDRSKFFSSRLQGSLQ